MKSTPNFLSKIKLQNNQVILPVKNTELIAFLYDTFETPRNDVIKLSRTKPVGRFITSLRSYSSTPAISQAPPGWISVVIELPQTSCSTFERHFNYFKAEHIEQINDYLQATYDLFFYRYFFDPTGLPKFVSEGTKENELTKMHLVDSFIFGLNLVDEGNPFDTIKKREYRKNVEILTKKRKYFLQKERRNRIELYNKRKKFISNLDN